MSIVTIAIHGGAGSGSDFIETHEVMYLQSLQSIVRQGYEHLKAGGTALDIVTQAVCQLEDDPLFNAGRGAAINAAGGVQMDAAIMDGRTLKAGSVVNQSSFKNPVLLARAVMEDTPYVVLTGDGLEALRQYKKWDKAPAAYFETPHQLQDFQQHKEDNNDGNAVNNLLGHLHGTVGAVALDQYGNIAAATSTGGASYCLPGRVSDSCMIGAGCYANNESCAVSGTGDGEFLITGVVAHQVAALVELGGLALQDACEAVLQKYPSEKCDMGIISVNRAGQVGIAFNCDRMHRAWVDNEGNLSAALYKQDS